MIPHLVMEHLVARHTKVVTRPTPGKIDLPLPALLDADNGPGADGGVVSEQAPVCWLTVAIPETFPAASTAATPTYTPRRPAAPHTKPPNR